MAFEIRLDGERLAVYHTESPSIAGPVERLEGADGRLDAARTRYWIELGATRDADADARLARVAPDLLGHVPQPTDEAPDFGEYEADALADPEQGEPGRKTRAGDPPAGLKKLLSYHKVDYDTFAPHEARFFEGLRDLLAWHGIVGADDTLGPDTFADAVKRFQAKAKLSTDGLPGRDTLWALQRDWACERKLDTARVPADPWGDAYDRFTLRADVAERYEGLYADIKRRGGRITSAGSFRSLSASVGAGRSKTSIHYAGVALDLAPYSGLAKIRDEDPYLVERDLAGRGWRVWCRSDTADPADLAPMTWKGKLCDGPATHCAAFDLSEVFRRHGFADIGPRRGYEKTYSCLEWWHFQCEAVLVPFVSQFGAELLSLARYDEKTLSKTDAWAYNKNVFKSRNNGWH